MFRVITVANNAFFPQTKRLAASLLNSGNDCHLTVFCEAAEAFGSLARSGRCAVRELPEIKTLGVKRAKFTAYMRALEDGDFLYLDSDVIVLQPIQEITYHKNITGCFDDLNSVRCIRDPQYPWPGDPSLENRIFINSGVFYAPTSRSEFFKELRMRSLRDELWNRYTIPGCLYDNSFLCAHFNLLNERVEHVDSAVYNWQGFVVDGRLQVERRGKCLVNRRTGQVLKVAHFAGVNNPDAAMCTWPVEVTSLLAGLGSESDPSPENALVEFLGTFNHAFDSPPADPTPRQMLDAVIRETYDLARTYLQRDYSERRAYFADKTTLISLAHSIPPSTYLWNGLACGGAYLTGDEYNFFQSVVSHFGIRTVLETGAGETSILLKRLGVEALSIESKQGPWLERARDRGCRCELVNFDQETAQFDPVELRRAVDSFAGGTFDMLFVDSPPGTPARSGVLDQIASIARPKYVLVHDALRDSGNILRYQQQFGLRLVDFMPSERGFAFFEFGCFADSDANPCVLPGFDPDLKLHEPKVCLELADERVAILPEDRRGLRITVTNAGAETLSSRYSYPVHLSYHWVALDHQIVVWDGDRTVLPFDILPGNAATFDIKVTLPPTYDDALLCLTLVQEGICWFDVCDRRNRLLVRVSETKASITPAAMA